MMLWFTVTAGRQSSPTDEEETRSFPLSEGVQEAFETVANVQGFDHCPYSSDELLYGIIVETESFKQMLC